MHGGIFRKEPYCAKIVSKEADAMTRIERITEMERCLDASRAAVDRLAEAFDAYEAVQKDYIKLSEYYGSAKWNDDYDADAAGKLPAGLKKVQFISEAWKRSRASLAAWGTARKGSGMPSTTRFVFVSSVNRLP